MAWFYLLGAGIVEICLALSLKYNEGFTKIFPSIMTLVTTAISFYLLSVAVKQIPIGTAYSVWTGVGAAGTVVLSIFLFQEPMGLMKLMGLLMVISGVMVLKLC